MHPGFFPAYMANMVSAAEEGGTIDLVMNRLAVHFEKDHKLNQKIRSAIAYPIAVTVFSALSVFFILIFVLPSFAATFEAMDAQLPMFTLMLLKTGDFFREYGLYLAAATVFLSCMAKILEKNSRVERMKETIILGLPIFGVLHKKAAIAKFSRILAILMRSGISIVRSLEIIEKIFMHSIMAQILADMRTSIVSGKGLSVILRQNAFFPPMVVQMAAVGEEAGDLEKMLEKIADFYDEDVDGTLARLSSILEPMLIGILGIIIGLIIVAVILPIFEMSALIN